MPKEVVFPRPRLPAATQNLRSSSPALGTEGRNHQFRDWAMASITSHNPGKVQSILESL